MTKIKIDDFEYEYDALPEEAKTMVRSLQFVEAELAQLGARTAAMQTARTAYYNALKQAIPPLAVPLGEVIRFS